MQRKCECYNLHKFEHARLIKTGTFMKLLASLTSPYARKIRVVLMEKRIEVDLVEENVWAPDTKVVCIIRSQKFLCWCWMMVLLFTIRA